MASFGASVNAPGLVAATNDLRDATLLNGASLVLGRAANRMLWPSTNSTSFSCTTSSQSTMQTVKMIRPPNVYVATHDTMPPHQQVIHAMPTHDVLRQLYQQTDRKMTGKRDAASTAPDVSTPGKPRPVKAPRTN